MNTSALIMYLVANITVIAITGYFFYKVLTTPPSEPQDEDSDYTDVHGPKTFDAT